MPSFYQTHPATCAPDDYWGQVRRTVNGQPISAEQIELIVESMGEALELGSTDRLLDLCCGNGALTSRWFARCAGGIGVDNSEPLIQVAQADFAKPPREQYLLASVLDFARAPGGFGDVNEIEKAICFASVQYLPRELVRIWLADLRRSMPKLRRLVLGNLPDRERIGGFAKQGTELPLDDPESALGCWWSQEELTLLAQRAGYRCHIQAPPEAFYAAHYRFDAILEPLPI